MIIETQTITEIKKSDNSFLVTCFYNLNEEGNPFPEIFKSKVLSENSIIDNIHGKEGELILSTNSDSKNVGFIQNGELTIKTELDDINKYNKVEENLIYE